MVYKAIGLMSGSSLDGLDIVFAELHETSGKWEYKILCADCIEYEKLWLRKLKEATGLSAKNYQLLHASYGIYLGEKVNEFIELNQINHQVNLVASHGHTTFHFPKEHFTHQLGDGSAIAATTKLPVVSDLRSMDVAFGGEGAPIVPLGEKLLFPEYHHFLNIGGIANLTVNQGDNVIAFDICPANRVMNMLAAEQKMEYDDEGKMASSGQINIELLNKLNLLDYYFTPAPKSLTNYFGTDEVYPLIKSFNLEIKDALRTYSEHISIQLKNALQPYSGRDNIQKLMVTGGGAFNNFLMERIRENLEEINFEINIPENVIVKYKEALIMALLGILRWRQQYTVLASVTGASQDSIGGALWLGTEA